MTRAERNDLCSLCRQREKLAKVSADMRGAELRADVERQLSAIFHFDNDAVWGAAREAARAAVEEARRTIAKRSRDLGIPSQYVPDLNLYWSGRGENAIAARRVELRKTALARIDALVKDAKLRIESSSVEIQTKLLSDALASDDARTFLESMPAAKDLMPQVLLTTAEAPGLSLPGGNL